MKRKKTNEKFRRSEKPLAFAQYTSFGKLLKFRFSYVHEAYTLVEHTFFMYVQRLMMINGLDCTLLERWRLQCCFFAAWPASRPLPNFVPPPMFDDNLLPINQRQWDSFSALEACKSKALRQCSTMCFGRLQSVFTSSKVRRIFMSCTFYVIWDPFLFEIQLKRNSRMLTTTFAVELNPLRRYDAVKWS